MDGEGRQESVSTCPREGRAPRCPVHDTLVDSKAEREAGESMDAKRNGEPVDDEPLARIGRVQRNVQKALDDPEGDAGERGQDRDVKPATATAKK